METICSGIPSLPQDLDFVRVQGKGTPDAQSSCVVIDCDTDPVGVVIRAEEVLRCSFRFQFAPEIEQIAFWLRTFDDAPPNFGFVWLSDPLFWSEWSPLLFFSTLRISRILSTFIANKALDSANPFSLDVESSYSSVTKQWGLFVASSAFLEKPDPSQPDLTILFPLRMTLSTNKFAFEGPKSPQLRVHLRESSFAKMLLRGFCGKNIPPSLFRQKI